MDSKKVKKLIKESEAKFQAKLNKANGRITRLTTKLEKDGVIKPKKAAAPVVGEEE